MQRGRHFFHNFVQKHCTVFWARSHLRWTKRQLKRVPWSEESHFSLFFRKNGHQVLRAKDEKDHSDCCQPKVQKPASVMGVHQCPRHGWSAYMRRYQWCRGLCRNFGETYAAVKTTTFPRNSMSISAGQCQASALHELQQLGFVAKECVCLTGLHAVQICLLLKMYGA